MTPPSELDLATSDRLVAAEQKGLRLAVYCRTVAVAVAAAWWIGSAIYIGSSISPWAISILSGMIGFGFVTALLIGTPLDRWWVKYLLYAIDILAVCGFFALVPVRVGADIPQIIAFRAYGIYYLFPLIAMACLSLSWRLVLWSGAIAAVGWWAAFLYVFAGMERRLGWGDFPPGADRADYEAIFLSIDFAGLGNRYVETGTLLIAAIILAVAVYRARQVFFAQIRAESEWLGEQRKRERISAAFGRFVPAAVADQLIENDNTLAPQVRHASILILDVAGFSAFSSSRPPKEVIETLNDFLAEAASTVSANNGVVIQFTGDGLLAAFNTPLEISEPEKSALSAGRGLIAGADTSGFKIRVGIASGSVAAGSVGSANRQAYTVYGDTVNRAARLESLAKTLGAVIVLDGASAAAVGMEGGISHSGTHRLRGLADPVEVWVVE